MEASPRGDVEWLKMIGVYRRDGTPITGEDAVLQWAYMSEQEDRRVALTLLTAGDCTVKVSTVFLGLDHNFSGGGPPLIFETMAFGDDTEVIDRYPNEEQALAGHRATVAEVASWLTEPHIEYVYTSAGLAEGSKPAPSGDILDRIDAVCDGCLMCGGTLGRSPSDDFCSEPCQLTWTRTHKLVGSN